MADRPILFPAPMIRALLDGRKTQTRRIIKPQPDDLAEGQVPKQLQIAIGDRLWVRETWCVPDAYLEDRNRKTALEIMNYAATPWGIPGKWRLSIFMPRWASRITLKVTDVRIERLQDISEADAVAEGCFKGKASGRVFANEAAMHLGGDEWANARDWYADLWDSINGDGAWDANPWVAAYTFEVIKQNIDQIERDAA